MSPFELTWLQRQIKLHVNPHRVSALPSSPAQPCPAQSSPGYLLVDRRLAGLCALLLVLYIICVNCDRPWQNITECKVFAPVYCLRTSLCCLHLLTLRISAYSSLWVTLVLSRPFTYLISAFTLVIWDTSILICLPPRSCAKKSAELKNVR